jgi:signal transduction histidine kinase
MQRIRHLEEFILRSRRVPAMVTALALAVLAGVVLLTTLQLRHRIREQIAGRDGEVLHAVAMMHYAQDVEDGLAGPITEPGGQLGVVLKTAQLRGVMGVRVFDTNGRFVDGFPFDLTEQDLEAARLPPLQRFEHSTRFQPNVRVEDLFLYPVQPSENSTTIPLLEVTVPLHTQDAPLAGIAQFLVEGGSIAAEYARLDRRLAWQALAAFGAGGSILTLALVWAFRRLRRAQRLLSERTENLLKANQELALAAKTSALGAVTAHLIHGLKNPLAGLQSFVGSRGASSESGESSDWEQALASTRRMQAMINQVVGVLREEQAGTNYEVTLAELEQMVRSRVQPLARAKDVNLTSVVQAEAALPNRVANLAALILVNLVENAVQATPKGKSIALAVRRDTLRIVFEVRDEGAGFPADTPLFMPCRSAKEGGTGIGLALCKQLAQHLGAELDLATSTASGCVFALRLPAFPPAETPSQLRLPAKDPVAD